MCTVLQPKDKSQFSGLICRVEAQWMAVWRQYGQLPANGPWPGRQGRTEGKWSCQRERRWAADYQPYWLIYSYNCSCTFSHLIMNPCPTQSFSFSLNRRRNFHGEQLKSTNWCFSLLHVLTHSFTHYCWQSVLAASTDRQQWPQYTSYRTATLTTGFDWNCKLFIISLIIEQLVIWSWKG